MKKITIKTMTSGGRRLMMICALLLMSVLFNLSAVMAQSGRASFINAGTYIYHVPAGVYSIDVTCGGGGGAGGSSTAFLNPGAGGGGGGGYHQEVFAVTPGETLNVTVGTGGPQGGSGTSVTVGFSNTYLNLAEKIQAFADGDSDPTDIAIFTLQLLWQTATVLNNIYNNNWFNVGENFVLTVNCSGGNNGGSTTVSRPNQQPLATAGGGHGGNGSHITYSWNIQNVLNAIYLTVATDEVLTPIAALSFIPIPIPLPGSGGAGGNGGSAGQNGSYLYGGYGGNGGGPYYFSGPGGAGGSIDHWGGGHGGQPGGVNGGGGGGGSPCTYNGANPGGGGADGFVIITHCDDGYLLSSPPTATTICPGETSVLTVYSSNIPGGLYNAKIILGYNFSIDNAFDSYLYIDGTTHLGTLTLPLPLQDTTTVTITNISSLNDNNACGSQISSNNSVHINVINLSPVITASPSTTVNYPSPVTLDAYNSNYSSYLWSNGATTSSITVDATGNYSVFVTEGMRCVGTATVSVTVNGSHEPLLWSMTTLGGSNNLGTIFSMHLDGSGYTVKYNFDGINGEVPYGSLMQASDSKFYGMTIFGGTSDLGVLFSFNPNTSTYTKLLDFNGTNGGRPAGDLVQAGNGLLYGMTSGGGTNGFGVLFSFNPVTNVYANLLSFDDDNGAYSGGNLIQASNGNLYGMTYSGGTSELGVLFKFNLTTNIYTKILDFDGSNGSYPYGSLMQATNGKLYGMTSSGGAGGQGILFSIDITSNIFNVIENFGFDDLSGYPYGNLIQGTDGALYGMTSAGTYDNSSNGTLFKFAIATSTFTTIDNFITHNIYAGDGSIFVHAEPFMVSPYGSLMQASNNKFYGMTSLGGTGSGNIFSYDPANYIVDIRDLVSPDGITPHYSNFIEADSFHLSIGTIVSTTVCAGDSFSIPFYIASPFINGNTFTAQLSDANGGFANAVTIGSSSSMLSGNIMATIPANTSFGTQYRIRVISSSPAITSNLSTDMTIKTNTSSTITGNTTACGSVTLTAPGGNSYQWSDGSNPNSATNTFTKSGNYFVTVTGGNGCTSVASPVVTVNPQATITSISNTSPVCPGTNVQLYSSERISDYLITKVYNITGDNLINCPSVYNNNWYGQGSLGPIGFNWIDTAINGLDSIVNVSISFQVDADGNGGTRTISLNNIAQTPTFYDPRLYLIDNNNLPQTLNWVPSNYLVGVTNTFLVTNISSDFFYGFFGFYPGVANQYFAQVTVTYQLPRTISWSPSTYLSSASILNPVVSNPTSNTVYTETITNYLGCTASANTTVVVNSLPTPSINGNTTDCDIVSLTASGGTTYMWSGGTSPNSATNTFTSSVIYTVTVTNSNNCSATTSATVTVNTLPSPSITPNGSTTFCNGGSVLLTVSPLGSSYHWSNGATTNSITVTSGGIYSITLTDNNGCTGTASSTTITVNANPTASTSAGTIACHGGTTTITVSASGATSPYSGTGINTVNIGTYSYTVTDANGCHATTSVTVTQPTTLVASSSQGTAIACNGGTTTITVSASGGTTPYSGTGVNTVTAGTYSYTVTDANGCYSTTSQAITQPALLTFTTVKSNVSGCGNNSSNGSIAITASGGIGTKVFSKNNGSAYQGASLFSNLSVGTYSVKVKDANGCISAPSANIITTNAGVTFNATVTNATACTTANGRITVIASGGSGYFNYSKDSGVTYQSSNIFNSLLHGTYKTRIKDVLGCLSSVAYTSVGPSCQARLEENTNTQKTSFNIYPNPTKDNLTIAFSSDKEQTLNLRLIDVTGKVVINLNHASVIGDNQYELNLSKVAKGIYMVILQNGDAVMHGKIVVQ